MVPKAPGHSPKKAQKKQTYERLLKEYLRSKWVKTSWLRSLSPKCILMICRNTGKETEPKSCGKENLKANPTKRYIAILCWPDAGMSICRTVFVDVLLIGKSAL